MKDCLLCGVSRVQDDLAVRGRGRSDEYRAGRGGGRDGAVDFELCPILCLHCRLRGLRSGSFLWMGSLRWPLSPRLRISKKLYREVIRQKGTGTERAAYADHRGRQYGGDADSGYGAQRLCRLLSDRLSG